jgi:hypothetical protein
VPSVCPGPQGRPPRPAAAEDQKTGPDTAPQNLGRALPPRGYAGEQASARQDPCGLPGPRPRHAVAGDPAGVRPPPHARLRQTPRHGHVGDPAGARPPPRARLRQTPRHGHVGDLLHGHPVPRCPAPAGDLAAGHRLPCDPPNPAHRPGCGETLMGDHEASRGLPGPPHRHGCAPPPRRHVHCPNEPAPHPAAHSWHRYSCPPSAQPQYARSPRHPADHPNQPAPGPRRAFAPPSRPRIYVLRGSRHGAQASLPPRFPPHFPHPTKPRTQPGLARPAARVSPDTAVRAASVRTEATLTHDVRRRPTLPRGPPRSTIGAEELNFRVRNGTGCFPFAMTAETLWRFRSSAFPEDRPPMTRPTAPREPHSGRDPFGGPGVAPRASTAPGSRPPDRDV